jgi:hypothetical protein
MMLEAFLELLLWSSFHAIITLDLSNILKSLSLYGRQFLETARSHSEQNQGKRVGVPFQ